MTWEIDLVRWLQSFPGLLLPMAAVSALGSPAFYLGLIAVIAWWRERSFALELSVLFAVSAIVNDLAKLVVHAPRPYWVSADVVPLELQDSFGFPSAHAQLAISMWGFIALRLGGPWAAFAAAAVVVAVGISRIALGVHYPVDVLGGWLIGAAVLRRSSPSGRPRSGPRAAWPRGAGSSPRSSSRSPRSARAPPSRRPSARGPPTPPGPALWPASPRSRSSTP